jgi:AcrR family transcriptional regulator
MAEPSPRERLISAAIAMFEEVGYDAVTVEAIAQRAGVGRTTLFRLFGSKEGLVFPDHDALLANVELRLATATRGTVLAAVVDAARSVFSHYLQEGELARARWRLTSSVPALRDREIASVGRYIRVFRRHLVLHLAEEPNTALRAELIATAVVTAHNNVLRRWLRGETTQPTEDFAAAMSTTLALFGRSPGNRTAVVVFGTDEPLELVLPRVERALADAADDGG